MVLTYCYLLIESASVSDKRTKSKSRDVAFCKRSQSYDGLLLITKRRTVSSSSTLRGAS